jgi:1-acyl-sn-glycerol-3-phosphate acyltransferase
MSINARCGCNKMLSCKTNLIMLVGCGHFLHQECYMNIMMSNNKECTVCGCVIGEIMTEDMIKKNKASQYYVELMALKYESEEPMNYMYYPSSISKLNIIVNQLMLCKTNREAHNVAKTIINMINIKIKIINNTRVNRVKYHDEKIDWLDKKDRDTPKILISNHNTFIDPVIIFYLFNCGFIASEFIKQIPLGDIICNKCNLLLIKRGKNANGTVEQIKQYLHKNKIIALFPQGGISYKNTLSKFRTGAFYSSDTICPLSIKYEPMIMDHDFITYFMKLLSNPFMNVTITVNDFEKGPFDNERIEQIRCNIARQSNLRLSNVDIRGVQD